MRLVKIKGGRHSYALLSNIFSVTFAFFRSDICRLATHTKKKAAERLVRPPFLMSSFRESLRCVAQLQDHRLFHGCAGLQEVLEDLHVQGR